jgi:hypothetical protein
MVVKLEELGSIRVAVSAEQLPELEDTNGPPW